MVPPILRQINTEVSDFENKHVQIVPGMTFNQHDTIERIYYYYNSKYQTGEVDEEGDRKYFFNIVKNPCKVFSKAVDFDTKNIRVLTTGGGDPLKTWFMERDLKFWLREKNFGRILNRIFMELPIFGTVVLKIVDGTPYFVDLRNFIVEQSADKLEHSNYITEVHNFTPAKFRKVGAQMKWDKDKIEEAITRFREMKGVSHIRVYERYGEVAEEDGSGNVTYPYKRVFVADVGVDEYDQFNRLVVQHAGIELSSEEWDGHPYWEIHGDKIPGRWLGIGVVETLFEPQIRQNEIANLQSKASYWAALRVFQTRDAAVARNLLTDTRNGEVLNVDSEITQIDMSDRNLAFFADEYQKWIRNRDELTFSYDVVQGERLPSGTPLGSAKIAASQTLSYFEQIQENIALDIKEMLYEVILPRFAQETSKEHVLRLVGQDLETYANMVKGQMLFSDMLRRIKKSKGFNLPTEKEKEIALFAIDQAIKQNKEQLVTIPKGFYKDLKYDIDIDITGESIDTAVRASTLFAILQAITADPTITQDPMKRKILFRMAEDGGVNPNDFFPAEPTQLSQIAEAPTGRAGGGVSAPVAMPGATQQTTTV